MLGRDGDQVFGLGGIECDGFLTQHRFAGREHHPRGRVVGRVRTGDVDDVDVRVGGECFPGAVRPGDLMFGGEPAGRIVAA